MRERYTTGRMPTRRALITGITGQDGSYLAELLLDEGYEVFGPTRRLSASNYWRIQHILDRVTLIPGDLLDQLSLIRALEKSQPHEVYNLAAMSFVPAFWDQPMLTGECNSQGVTRVLEAERTKGKSGLMREEREELVRLRKENRELRMERDILKKASAIFAKYQP